MGEEKMLAWSDIDYRIGEITYTGEYYFTMGHVKEGYYCLIYNSTDEYSAVVVINQEKSLQQAVSKAIEEFVEKFLKKDLEPPVKVKYDSPSDKGMECYTKPIYINLYDLVESVVEEKLNSLKISM